MTVTPELRLQKWVKENPTHELSKDIAEVLEDLKLERLDDDRTSRHVNEKLNEAITESDPERKQAILTELLAWMNPPAIPETAEDLAKVKELMTTRRTMRGKTDQERFEEARDL